MITHHLRKVTDLCAYTVVGAGDPLGMLSGLVFSPDNWHVRHFVIMGESLPRKPVVLPTQLFRAILDDSRKLEVDVSAPALRSAAEYRPAQLAGSNLFDAAGLIGRRLDGSDTSAGKVADLLVNVHVWALRYFLIDTPSGRVPVDVEWCSSLDADQDGISVDLPAQAIATAPPYQGLGEFCSGYEQALYRHYTSRSYLQRTDAA